jgi:uncharacterized membrane protein
MHGFVIRPDFRWARLGPTRRSRWDSAKRHGAQPRCCVIDELRRTYVRPPSRGGGMKVARPVAALTPDWRSVMTEIIETIDVDVPVETAYNQWTQFEEFPSFMEGVHEVKQVDPTHLHWRAKIAGKDVEWDAEITEQVPDDRIAWTSRSGAVNAGVVTFHRLSPQTSRVTLQMRYEPKGALEETADLLGVVRRRVKGDLERFKVFIESMGVESGSWRGTVDRPNP